MTETASNLPAAGATRARRRPFRWLARAVVLAAAVLALAVGGGLVAGAFLPVPSTLMVARWLSSQPVDRVWVALENLPAHVPLAVLVSEDQRFCRHHGIDMAELRAVLDDPAGPRRGASTLTMQVAKNLFLWPSRSPLRKALELPLALAIDAAWPKPRIMEVYLNIAELGDGVFGVEAAAQAYFRKPAARLTVREAAALAAALPNPRLRNPARPSPRARTNTFVILNRMAAHGVETGCLAR